MPYRLIITGMLVAFFSLALWRTCAFITTIEEFDISFQGPLTEDGLNAILSELKIHTNTPLSALYSLLKKQFPFIDNLHLMRTPSRAVSLTFSVPEPCGAINKTWYIFPSGALCDRTYIGHQTDALPALITNASYQTLKENSSCLAHCLQNIPRQLFNEYDCIWYSASEVRLVAHDHSHEIVCLPNQLADTVHICKQLITRQPHLHTKKWVGDTRFKNQIILRKEGGEHGTHT